MYLTRCLAVALLVAPIATAAAAGPFDGTYSGENTLVRGGPPVCSPTHKITWTVADNHFKARWFSTTTLDAAVAPDGSFNTSAMYNYGRQASRAILTGKISNGALEADIESTGCKYHYSLKKV